MEEYKCDRCDGYGFVEELEHQMIGITLGGSIIKAPGAAVYKACPKCKGKKEGLDWLENILGVS